MDLPPSLKAEYEAMATDRSPYLERARDASKYTLPHLVPPAGKTSGSRLRHGYSNFGARCVNSLASKYQMSLLPARQAFFRYVLEDAMLEKLKAQAQKELLTEVEAGLSKVEAAILADIDTTPTRGPLGEAMKHLLVAGNVLAHDLPSGGLRVYGLQSYVVSRDGTGAVLSHICEDHVSPLALPESIRGSVLEKVKARNSREKTVCIYTGVFRTESGWKVWQEVEGMKVPGSDGTYPLDQSPWFALRFTPVDGESYGRGHVEDYLGYFISLEGLTAALVKGVAALSKVIYMRRPTSPTKASTVARAETGDVVDGNPEDVKPLESGSKAVDLSQAREMIRDLKEELSFVFAMHSAVQRNAERVTAEEIRFMAQELDSNNGGAYSTLALDFQLPLLNSRRARLSRTGKLPALPKKALKAMIVTGLDALGRGAELDNLRALVKDVVDLGGPQALETYLHFDDLLKRLTTARGVKAEGLIKDAATVAQELQQKQMQAMVQHLGPNAITQMGQLAKQQGAPAPTT